MEILLDRFLGDEDVQTTGPVSRQKGEALIARIKKSPNPSDKKCLKLACKLRVDGVIKNRKTTRPRNRLTALYDSGVSPGHLVAHAVEQPATKRRRVDAPGLD